MTTIDHQHPKVVFEPVLGRWRVEYRTQWTDEWQTHRYHHTLEEACEVAQEMTNNDLDGAYRVVDTQADMTTPRLSGPCSHGLPCTCDMPRTPRRPERRPPVTIPPQAVEAAPSRWRVDVTAPVKRWVPHALFNSREAAEAYAEALVKRSDLLNLMACVVDMDPSDPVTVAIFEEDNV